MGSGMRRGGRAAGRRGAVAPVAPRRALPGKAQPGPSRTLGRAFPSRVSRGKALPGWAFPSRALRGKALPGWGFPSRALRGKALPGRRSLRERRG
jgi:hypothetical protein